MEIENYQKRVKTQLIFPSQSNEAKRKCVESQRDNLRYPIYSNEMRSRIKSHPQDIPNRRTFTYKQTESISQDTDAFKCRQALNAFRGKRSLSLQEYSSGKWGNNNSNIGEVDYNNPFTLSPDKKKSLHDIPKDLEIEAKNLKNDWHEFFSTKTYKFNDIGLGSQIEIPGSAFKRIVPRTHVVNTNKSEESNSGSFLRSSPVQGSMKSTCSSREELQSPPIDVETEDNEAEKNELMEPNIISSPETTHDLSNIHTDNKEDDEVIEDENELAPYHLPRKINGRKVSPLDVIMFWYHGWSGKKPLSKWSVKQKSYQQSKISRWKRFIDIFETECQRDVAKLKQIYSNSKGALLPVMTILAQSDAGNIDENFSMTS